MTNELQIKKLERDKLQAQVGCQSVEIRLIELKQQIVNCEKDLENYKEFMKKCDEEIEKLKL